MLALAASDTAVPNRSESSMMSLSRMGSTAAEEFSVRVISNVHAVQALPLFVGPDPSPRSSELFVANPDKHAPVKVVIQFVCID